MTFTKAPIAQKIVDECGLVKGEESRGLSETAPTHGNEKGL